MAQRHACGGLTALKTFLISAARALGALLPQRRPLPPTRHVRRARVVDIQG